MALRRAQIVPLPGEPRRSGEGGPQMLPASPALLSNSFFGDFAVLNVKLKNCIRWPPIKTWEMKKYGKIPASNDAKSLHHSSQWAQNLSANIHRTPTAYKYHDERAKDRGPRAQKLLLLSWTDKTRTNRPQVIRHTRRAVGWGHAAFSPHTLEFTDKRNKHEIKLKGLLKLRMDLQRNKNGQHSAVLLNST